MTAYRVQSIALFALPRVEFLYVNQCRQNGERSVDVLHRFGDTDGKYDVPATDFRAEVL